MRTRHNIFFVIACFVCILLSFPIYAPAEETTKYAWVWNSDSFRVMLYETPNLTNANRFYNPYLLNGFPVRIQEWDDSGNSVCVSFLEHTYWVDSKHICILPPAENEYHVFRSMTENVRISSQNEGIIPLGTRVDIRGYTGKSVIINYNGEIQEIHPSSIQMLEITYEAPEYLLSQAEIIPLCKQELVNVYGLSKASIESMRMDFISYSTLSSPALYIIRFTTDTGEIYTIDCDGEFGVILGSQYFPYAVG